ncbi:MAG: N-acetylmuramoyl-L-alanine amidase [Balneolaceae bacterium]
MRILGVFFSSFFVFSSALFAQINNQGSDSLYLNIVIPETDTVIYSFSKYRIAANTHTDAKAYINGKEVKVYSTGAFVDFIDHEEDTTKIEFRVEKNGESLSKIMYLIRPPEVDMDLPDNIISDLMVLPSEDMWIKHGETLTVQFQGKPGQEALFSINGVTDNIRMKEVPEDLVEGKKGVYRGTYVAKPNDFAKDRRITFKIKKGLLGYHKKETVAKVSFLKNPIVGEVIAKKAYLNIGLGTDRLGGAKYGYIQEGVKLNIVGKQKNAYKVKLSESLDAWIPTSFVELLNENVLPISSLTGNIRISGNSATDLIRVSLSEKLPYISYQELDPNKIIVDIFGATSNTNWKIKHLTSHGIKNVDWQQVENDRFRLTIELDHSQNWGYELGYGWGSTLDISIRKPPIVKDVTKPLSGRTIAIDAGHGGSNNGALGATGTKEKEINLQISEILKTKLEIEGVNVIMTRTDDQSIFMSERWDRVLNSKADLLLSIHANSIGYGNDPLKIKGAGSLYKHLAFKPLAEIIYNRLLSLGLYDYGLIGNFNFTLNQPTEFPNVLVETAFLSNPEEEMLLLNIEFQSKIAEEIVKGLKQFYLERAYLETISDQPDK